MAKQSATEKLRERIALLEIKQKEDWEVLKEELSETYESLKPVNLLKNTIKDFASSEELKISLFETIIAIINNFLAKQLQKSNPSNLWMKLLSVAIQLGVTNMLSRNRDTISEFLQKITDKLLSEKETTQ